MVVIRIDLGDDYRPYDITTLFLSSYRDRSDQLCETDLHLFIAKVVLHDYASLRGKR